MRPLHIIMPMAGEGSRFLKEGWMVPKPLIQLHGAPLFIRAINSLDISDIEMKYSFIVRQEHIDKYDIDKMIRDYLPVANVYSVLKTTRYPASSPKSYWNLPRVSFGFEFLAAR